MVEQDKKEFVINNHLTLKLEGVKTKIFVDGEEFLICKAVILNIPKNEVLKVKSMDDLLEISEITPSRMPKLKSFLGEGRVLAFLTTMSNPSTVSSFRTFVPQKVHLVANRDIEGISPIA